MQDYLSDLYKKLSGKMKLGLERSRMLMELLGHPEKSFPSIHVAGTNGKGSVTALAASLLEAGGLKVGRFTSPHLVNFSERITVNGIAIPDEAIKTYLRSWESYLEETKASFFEVTCALAFAYFRDMGVDAAVVETGLGGRLDATSVLHPRVAVITSIGYDHMDVLGDTLPKIAEEKAGIIKADVPLVTCRQDPEIMEVFRSHTGEIRIADPDSEFCDISLSADRMLFRIRERGLDCAIPLIGRHQLSNIAMAVRAAEIFSGRPLADDELRRGCANVSWKGRFERIRREPDIIYDVAHNPDGIKVFSETLKEVYPHKKIYVVFGMLADKQPLKAIPFLNGLSERMWICPVDSARSMDGGQLRQLAETFPGIELADSITRACTTARKLMPDHAVLCVLGSHYIAAELYAWNSDKK